MGVEELHELYEIKLTRHAWNALNGLQALHNL